MTTTICDNCILNCGCFEPIYTAPCKDLTDRKFKGILPTGEHVEDLKPFCIENYKEPEE